MKIHDFKLKHENFRDVLQELGYSRYYFSHKKNEEELNKLFMAKYEVFRIESEEVETSLDSQSVGVDITDEEYHGSDNLGSSKLALLYHNPKHFKTVYIDKTEKVESEALLIGSAFHCLTLEPDDFKKRYEVINLSGSLKSDYVKVLDELKVEVTREENKKGEIVAKDTIDVLKQKLEQYKELSPKQALTISQMKLVEKLSKQALGTILTVRTPSKYGDGAIKWEMPLKDILDTKPLREVEKAFYGEINGEKVQIKVDLLVQVGLMKDKPVYIAIDLKSARESNKSRFEKNVSAHNYDVQSALYTEVLRQNGIDIIDFRFWVAGKDEYSDGAMYVMQKDSLEIGLKVAKAIIEKYKYCKNNNLWLSNDFNYRLMRYDVTQEIETPFYKQMEYSRKGINI